MLGTGEIPRPSLFDKPQAMAPTKPGAALHEVQGRFDLSLMMRPGFHVGLHPPAPAQSFCAPALA